MTTLEIEDYEQRAKAWVEALPSYEQGYGGLHRDGDGYCCLGVACDITGIGEWIDNEEDDGEGNGLLSWWNNETEETEASLMPLSMVEYYGLSDEIGSFDWFTLPSHLRWMILQHLTSHDVRGTIEDDQRDALMDPQVGSVLHGRPNNLAWMNDRGIAFWLIAEIIKARPKGLFKWSTE